MTSLNKAGPTLPNLSKTISPGKVIPGQGIGHSFTRVNTREPLEVAWRTVSGRVPTASHGSTNSPPEFHSNRHRLNALVLSCTFSEGWAARSPLSEACQASKWIAGHCSPFCYAPEAHVSLFEGTPVRDELVCVCVRECISLPVRFAVFQPPRVPARHKGEQT